MHRKVGDVLPMICPWNLHENFGYLSSWNQRWSITMKNPIKLPSKSPEKVTMKSQSMLPNFFRKKKSATRLIPRRTWAPSWRRPTAPKAGRAWNSGRPQRSRCRWNKAPLGGSRHGKGRLNHGWFPPWFDGKCGFHHDSPKIWNKLGQPNSDTDGDLATQKVSIRDTF